MKQTLTTAAYSRLFKINPILVVTIHQPCRYPKMTLTPSSHQSRKALR